MLTMSKAIATAGALTLAAILGACASGADNNPNQSNPSTKTGPAPSEVSIAVRTDWDTLDPQKTLSLEGSQQMIDALYDTLVTRGADGSVQPNIATSWEQTPAKVVLRLRTDATCGDGTRLTATHIAASLRRLSDPATGAPYASRIFGPAGVSQISADDSAATVTIELKQPFADALSELSLTSAAIVCPAGLTDPGSMATKPAGSGPYALASMRRGDTYTLTRRDDYTGLPTGTKISDLPKTLTIKVATNATTSANLLVTSAVTIGSVLGQDVSRVRSLGLFETVVPSQGADSLVFNHDPSRVTADPAIRRALSMAVDRNAYVKAATFDIGKPSATLYTPTTDCYNADDASASPPLDVEGAKKLLAQAGFQAGPDGKLSRNGKPLTLRIVGYVSQNSGPAYLQTVFEALGATVTVTSGSFDQFVGVVFGGSDWDAFVYPFNAASHSPALLVNQTSGTLQNSLNAQKTTNATYESLVPKAMAATGAERCKLWDEAERALVADADALPLVEVRAPWFGRGVAFTATYWVVDTKSIRSLG